MAVQFDYVDADHNDAIDLQEFDNLLRMLGLYLSEATTLSIFRRIDLDGASSQQQVAPRRRFSIVTHC